MDDKMLDILKKALGLNKRDKDIFNYYDKHSKEPQNLLNAEDVLNKYLKHMHREVNRSFKSIKKGSNSIKKSFNNFVEHQKAKFLDESLLFNSPYLKLQYNVLNKLKQRKENKSNTSGTSLSSYGNYAMQHDFVQNKFLRKIIPQSLRNKYFNFVHQEIGGKYLRNAEKIIKGLSVKFGKKPTAFIKRIFNKKEIRDKLINKLGKNSLKSFANITGYALNVDTIFNDPSYFKKTFSLMDIIGDATGMLGPFTSVANFAGTSIYDFALKDSQKKVADDISKEYLKSYLPIDMFNIDTMYNDTSNFKKFLAKNDIIGDRFGAFSIPSSFTSSINLTGSLMYDYILSDSMKNKLDTIFKKKNNMQLRKSSRIPTIVDNKRLGNNAIDLYRYNNSSNKKNYLAMHHNREVAQTKLQDNQTVSPGQNTFTININGTNKSTQEIMNEMVPEIKLRMKNISIA